MNSSIVNSTNSLNLTGGPELNLISLILVIITIGFCLFVLILTIRTKNQTKYSVNVILSCNTYLCIMIFSIFAFTQHLRTLFGDFGRKTDYGIQFGIVRISSHADLICRLATFFIYAMLTNILLSVSVQAFFRMLKIMSSPAREYRLLNKPKGYLSVILFQWTLGFLFQIPNVIGTTQYWYEETQYNCIIAYSNGKTSAYSFIIVYVLPCVLLIIKYCYLIFYLRRQRNRINPISINTNINSKQRDMLVIKRIILSVGVLVSMGIPTLILMFSFILTGVVVTIRYRLQWFGVAFTNALFSIILLFISPQLMAFVPDKFRRMNFFEKRDRLAAQTMSLTNTNRT